LKGNGVQRPAQNNTDVLFPFIGMYFPNSILLQRSQKTKLFLLIYPFVEMYNKPIYDDSVQSESVYVTYGLKLGLSLQPIKRH
jgi:ABC-type polysaccharide/polyol phosphate export permease